MKRYRVVGKKPGVTRETVPMDYFEALRELHDMSKKNPSFIFDLEEFIDEDKV